MLLERFVVANAIWARATEVMRTLYPAKRLLAVAQVCVRSRNVQCRNVGMFNAELNCSLIRCN